MIALHFENLRLFLAQYVLSTLSAAAIYYYLGRTFPGKAYPTLRLIKVRYLGQSDFHSPVRAGRLEDILEIHILPIMFNESLKSLWGPDRLFVDLSYYFLENSYPSSYYESFSSSYKAPQVYESNIIYQLYRIMVAVSSWAGLMLVITPFSYIYVFLPHFADPYNIIVAIVLSIAIFEGLLSTIFFRIGTKFTNVILIESLVIVAFTLSLLSPSMAWIGNYVLQARLEIYLILLIMFAAITALISQLKTKRNLFLSSFLFSTIAYFSFVGIVLYNVLQFL